MKKGILFFAGLLLSSSVTFAQSSNSVVPQLQQKINAVKGVHFKDVHGHGSTASKTTSIASRVKTITVNTFDGAIFNPSTSVSFNFSGENGGDLQSSSPIRYDLCVETSYDLPTSTWINSSKALQTFDSYNNIDSKLEQSWNASTWDNSMKNIFTYDANHNILTETVLNWNTASNVWTNYHKYINTWDPNNNLSIKVAQNWNSSSNTWQHDYRYVYTYDANNNLLSSLYQTWNSATNTWDNSSRILFTYDANNNVILSVYQGWTSGWYNSSQVIYMYNVAGENTQQTMQVWNNSTSLWENFSKNLLTYDANHNATVFITQNWNNGGSFYSNVERTRYNYNAYNQFTSMETDHWNGGMWESIPNIDEQYSVTYETFTTTAVSDVKNHSSLNIYPSPAASNITLDLSFESKQPFTVSIFSAQGAVIRQWEEAATTSYHQTIGVSELTSGVYYIKVNTGKEQIVRAVSVLK
jgi:hypothetical protein